jgi:hypothetical protein
MYFVLYFLAGIVLFVFLLYKFLEIIFDKKGYSTTYYRVYALVLFLVMVVTFANILIASYTYRKTINIAGKRGDKGLKGNAGSKGKKGMCDEKCGQKVCYVDIIDAANKHFQENVKDLLGDTTLVDADNTTLESVSVITNITPKDYKIKNGVMLDKINGICKSDQYQSIMLGKHRKKPNEQKLITYLKKIIIEWIDFLTDVANTGGHRNIDSVETNAAKKTILLEEINTGVRFLLEPNWDKNRLDYTMAGGAGVDSVAGVDGNPFQEIEKYDIWNWGEGLKLKPLEIKIKTTDFELPKPDVARLNIIKSNNYQKVFDTAKPKDLWDDKQCDFDQMVDKNGDKTNPQNLNKCVFLNDSYLKDYINTWKTNVFKNKRELSLYNADSYKNERNQKFYPVGSVWRGNNSGEKPTGAMMSPKSKNSCGAGHGADGSKKANNQGPEKETILVSGDVKEPTDLTLMWDNKVGCERCQEGSHDTVKIYRPTAPDGYVCLGDYATTSKLTKDDIAEHKGKIRCVPKECVREKKIGSYFWNNKHVSHDRYNSYQSYMAKTPYESDSHLGASFWTAGIDNVGVAEEQKNLYGHEFEDDEGYNVFRVNKGFKRPNELKTYVIKEECLMPGGGKEPIHPEMNLTNILKGGNEQAAGLGIGAQYDVSDYYITKPKFAILTNISSITDDDTSITNFEGNPIKLYLLDDLNPTKEGTSDTYFLATFNIKKNDFSNYIVTSATNEIRIVDRVSKNNPYHRWVVEKVGTGLYTAGNYKGDENNTFDEISIISAANTGTGIAKKHLNQVYDSNAKSKFELLSTGSGGNWRYDSYLKGKLPNYKE